MKMSDVFAMNTTLETASGEGFLLKDNNCEYEEEYLAIIFDLVQAKAINKAINEYDALTETLRLKEEECNQLDVDKQMLISVLRHAISGWDYEEIAHHCGVDQNTASIVLKMIEE